MLNHLNHLVNPVVNFAISMLTLILVALFPVETFGQMSCGPRVSPRLLQEIPCDMSKAEYCNTPGSSYPWNSVRRYIYENQGLMRRMYGDQRQSLILKNEIDDIREKYDSVFVYGRGKGNSNGFPQFSPRAAFIDSEDTFFQKIPYKKVKTTSTTKEPTTTTTTTSKSTSPLEMTQNSSLHSENLEETTTSDTALPEDFTQILTEEAEGPTTTSFTKNIDDQAHPDLYSPEIEKSSSFSSTSSSTELPSSTTESQFSTEPIEKKGVNACPVKEEVIAPYWANNTRGETLALLNVYPFEQYVHWEKCAYENSQMFCKDGCRCEQQYRLHRLLAFDPKNECRGIFADWFRFPSCCVCICYDLPDKSYFYRINRRKSRL